VVQSALQEIVQVGLVRNRKPLVSKPQTCPNPSACRTSCTRSSRSVGSPPVEGDVRNTHLPCLIKNLNPFRGGQASRSTRLEGAYSALEPAGRR